MNSSARAKETYIADIMGVMQADTHPEITEQVMQVAEALESLPLMVVRMLHEIIVYCETH